MLNNIDECNVQCQPDMPIHAFDVCYTRPTKMVLEHFYFTRHEDTSPENHSMPSSSKSTTAQYEAASFLLNFRVWKGLMSADMHPEIRHWARKVFVKDYSQDYAEHQTPKEHVSRHSRVDPSMRAGPSAPTEPRANLERRIARLKHEDTDCQICFRGHQRTRHNQKGVASAG